MCISLMRRLRIRQLQNRGFEKKPPKFILKELNRRNFQGEQKNTDDFKKRHEHTGSRSF